MSTGRFKISEAVALLRDGRLLVAGGGTHVEVYDALRSAFSVADGEMDAERFYMTATALQDGRVLILGGYDGDIQANAQAWVYVP
jgi:hypothetical protein